MPRPLEHDVAVRKPVKRLHTKEVYLTFDDGPDVEWTPAVLDLLAVASTPATFFVIGREARAHAALVRRVVGAGHLIGNHGFTHRHPWLLSSAQLEQDFHDGCAAIADITGAAPHWFRPPHGRLRRVLFTHLQRMGQEVALWNLSAVDWGLLGTAPLIRQRLNKVSGGDIVLMHDARRQHNKPDQLVQVLPDFLTTLIGNNIRCSLLPT